MTTMRAAEAATCYVVKKIGPGQPGALRWARRFGDALICVRYRLTEDGSRRFTTVELLVDEAPTRRMRADRIVGLRIGVSELSLRERVKAAGGRWDPARKVWRIARGQMRTLGLDDRVVEE